MGGGGQLSKHRRVELNPHLAVPGSSRHLKNMWNNEWPPWRLQVKQVTTGPPAVPTRHRECKDSRGRCRSCFLIRGLPLSIYSSTTWPGKRALCILLKLPALDCCSLHTPQRRLIWLNLYFPSPFIGRGGDTNFHWQFPPTEVINWWYTEWIQCKNIF